MSAIATDGYAAVITGVSEEDQELIRADLIERFLSGPYDRIAMAEQLQNYRSETGVPFTADENGFLVYLH